LTLEQLAYLAQIVGVVLVIASLVYVAAQVRQNTAAQLASSRQTSITADVAIIAAMIAHPEVNEYASKPLTELTTTQIEQVGNLLAGFVRTREFAWSQYVNGVMDEATMNSYMGTLVRWIDMGDAGRKYWELFSREIDPEFVAHVEARRLRART